MYQQIQKRFAVMFTLLLVFMNIGFIQPASSHAAAVDQAVTITALDNNGEEVIQTAVVEIDDGDTAEDVLVKAAEVQKVALHLEDSSYGTSLNGIGDIEVPDDYSLFWAFMINGEEASVGISDALVTHGDNFTFLFTSYPIDEVNVKVSIKDASGKSIVNEEAINLIKHATFYDALVQTASKNDLDLDVTVDSDYFTFINNIDGLATKANEFWSLSVDDEPLQVGALSHHVSEDEHLVVQLTSFDDEVEEPETDENDTESDDEEVDKEETETPEENDVTKDDTALSDKEKEAVKVNKNKINKIINDELNLLIKHYVSANDSFKYGNEWIVYPLAKAGVDIPESYVNSIKKSFAENEVDDLRVTDLEKVIITLSTMGLDVSNFEGINLLSELENHPGLTGTTMSVIYGLLAFNSSEKEVNKEVEDLLIKYMLDNQVDDGGWGYSKQESDIDVTAMALQGLSGYQGNADVKKAITKAVGYLSESQDNNGGYFAEFNDGYSSESVSQVITGLVSVGIDPRSEEFTKDLNLLEFILQFKSDDGLYKHLIEDEASNDIATQQALLAFAFYNSYIGLEVEDITPPSEIETGNEKPETNEELNTNDEAEKQTGDRLPDTATPFYNILVVGLIVIILGIIVFVIQRRKQK